MSLPDPTSDLLDIPLTHEGTIPEEYRDEMGHMNVMWYAYLFGMATREIFNQFGMTRKYFDANHAGAFALETHTRYLSEVHVGEEVTIRTQTIARSAKRFHVMHYMIRNSDSRLAAIGELLASHIDMKTRRTSPFADSIALQIDDVIAVQQALPWDAPVSGSIAP